MKTMLLAAAAALTLGIGSAYAGDGDGQSATTLFTSIPGEQVNLGQPVAPRIVAGAQNNPVANAYVTSSHPAGTWLFPPDQFGGGDN